MIGALRFWWPGTCNSGTLQGHKHFTRIETLVKEQFLREWFSIHNGFGQDISCSLTKGDSTSIDIIGPSFVVDSNKGPYPVNVVQIADDTFGHENYG